MSGENLFKVNISYYILMRITHGPVLRVPAARIVRGTRRGIDVITAVLMTTRKK